MTDSAPGSATGNLESLHAEDVALEALADGSVQAAVRSSFGPGEAKALAIDAYDDAAAVLVIRRRRDDAWIVDVVRFLHEHGVWTVVGSGGGTYGDLPIDQDPKAGPSFGPMVTGMSFVKEHGVAAVGGFVVGAVDAVELAIGNRTRRVGVTPGSSAFVWLLPLTKTTTSTPSMPALWIGVAP